MSASLTRAQFKGKPPKFIIKGKLKPEHRAFVDEIVWNGLTRPAAASVIGITDAWARALMNSPQVITYMNEQLEVRRKGERPRNFHRLTEIRDQNDNKAAAVAAIKVLEQIDDDASRAGPGARDIRPGFVVQINVGSQPVSASQTAKPLELQATALNDELNERHEPGTVLWLDGRSDDEAKA